MLFFAGDESVTTSLNAQRPSPLLGQPRQARPALLLDPSFPGRWVLLGARKRARPACRDEVLAALEALSARSGRQVFTVGEVFVEMTV